MELNLGTKGLQAWKGEFGSFMAEVREIVLICFRVTRGGV